MTLVSLLLLCYDGIESEYIISSSSGKGAISSPSKKSAQVVVRGKKVEILLTMDPLTVLLI